MSRSCSVVLTVAGAAVLLASVSNPASAEVTFTWATVGNPGNAADPLREAIIPGIGSVAGDFRIAEHMVTNDQYAEFLGAVAVTDTNVLYIFVMGSDPRGGITQSGASGSFTYSVKADMGNKPVNFVSFFNAMRFVNWLHNGQPTGAQNASTTEDGVYAITDGVSETRSATARFFIPTESEWYKAAYHDPRTAAAGGPPGDDHYWLYPTASDNAPTIATATTTGDIANPGANVANYFGGATWNGLIGNLTTVGSAGTLSESFYGTSDQGGNLWEWNERLAGSGPSFRGFRGSSWRNTDVQMQSLFETGQFPDAQLDNVGFRVAGPATDIPTVSQWGLSAMVLLVLTAGTIAIGRRRPRTARG